MIIIFTIIGIIDNDNDNTNNNDNNNNIIVITIIIFLLLLIIVIIIIIIAPLARFAAAALVHAGMLVDRKTESMHQHLMVLLDTTKNTHKTNEAVLDK